MEINIHDIKRENLPNILSSLLKLEHNWVEIGEADWKRENFELELPGKWELSFYIENQGKILGYAICSSEGSVGKLNKIIVDSEYRGMGLGKILWAEFLNRLRKSGIAKAEFKVHVNNKSGIGLYKHNGCLFYRTEVGEDGRERHLCRYVFKLSTEIRHSSPTIDIHDKQAVAATVSEKDIASGTLVSTFISDLISHIGMRYGIATDNGTNALFLALRALEAGEGSEVILPSFVCYSVMSSVINSRAQPVLADINLEDYNISYEDVKKKISPRTKAIILPHMFGNPIKELAKFQSLGIPIIEDCAQSIGAGLKDKKTGAFGDISIFSFYATKLMTTATGGMLMTNNKKLYDRLRDLTTYDKRNAIGECYNFRMNDIQAALGIQQLKRMDEFLRARTQLAEKYNTLFEGSEYILPEKGNNIYYRYVIRAKEIEPMLASLNNRGVRLAKPIYRPLHTYLSLPDSEFPNTTEAYRTAVSVPIYPRLSHNEAEDITSAILNWRQESSYYIGGVSN